jgi:hypothetical protein
VSQQEKKAAHTGKGGEGCLVLKMSTSTKSEFDRDDRGQIKTNRGQARALLVEPREDVSDMGLEARAVLSCGK